MRHRVLQRGRDLVGQAFGCVNPPCAGPNLCATWPCRPRRPCLTQHQNRAIAPVDACAGGSCRRQCAACVERASVCQMHSQKGGKFHRTRHKRPVVPPFLKKPWTTPVRGVVFCVPSPYFAGSGGVERFEPALLRHQVKDHDLTHTEFDALSKQAAAHAPFRGTTGCFLGKVMVGRAPLGRCAGIDLLFGL